MALTRPDKFKIGDWVIVDGPLAPQFGGQVTTVVSCTGSVPNRSWRVEANNGTGLKWWVHEDSLTLYIDGPKLKAATTHVNNINNQGDIDMAVSIADLRAVKNLDDKHYKLYKAGWVNSEGSITGEGREAMALLLDDNVDKLLKLIAKAEGTTPTTATK